MTSTTPSFLADPPSPRLAWSRLHAAAAAPYRLAGRFAWHFARGKLGRDPVFRALVERGDLAGRARVVDIGCGQALLASLLQSCADLARAGAWPAAWGAAPAVRHYTGIELMQRDLDRARPLAGITLRPTLVRADMRDAALPAADLCVMLDVLHYIDHAAQQQVLERVRTALAPRGRLLLRVGDMAAHRGFRASQWVDRLVTVVRGHRVAPTWGRSVADWTALLQHLGFRVQPLPMSAGTPFANVLLIADCA